VSGGQTVVMTVAVHNDLDANSHWAAPANGRNTNPQNFNI